MMFVNEKKFEINYEILYIFSIVYYCFFDIIFIIKIINFQNSK